MFEIIVRIQAQESINIKGKTILGKEAQSEYWVFSDFQDTIVAINYSEFKKMVLEINLMKLEAVKLDSIVKAKNELIAAFEDHEKKADRHIVVQNNLITYADSLYSGYKGLYRDLKSIAGMKKIGLILGAGINKYEKEDMEYLFDAGIEYNKMQFSYQSGHKYNGLTVRYRVPLF